MLQTPSASEERYDAWMIDLLRFGLGLVADLFRGRAALLAENAMLRQQLIAAQRKIHGRVRWEPWQRFTMGLAARLTPVWRTAVLLVQPATILRWHRAGFRAFWRRRSRPVGRPPTAHVALIREMAKNNPRWGAERIRGELLKVGIRVCKRTIQRKCTRSRVAAATANAGRRSYATMSLGRPTSSRPTMSSFGRSSSPSSSTCDGARSSTPP
jgi:hypothetical protein